VLAVLFGGFWLLTRPIPVLAATGNYLGRINLLLALFNMIPGFPLDGGRVLRALLWWQTKNFHRSTRAATIAGQFVAFGFLGLGGFSILGGNFMNGLWLVFIGWFLQNAAATTFAQTNLQHAMQGIRVSQVMSTDYIRVPSLIPLNHLVMDYVINGGRNCFFVDDGTKLLGMITLRDITAIPQQKWRFLTTGQVMIPYSRLEKVSPEAELLTVMRIMDNNKVAQLPVVRGEELVGVISREQVMHYLRSRAELRI
jgi:CBS domain-containing protein